MSGRSGAGLTGSQGNALKSKQFYEMFRTQSRVLKAKEAHDEAKSGEEQRLDKLYTILKEKETGSGKGISPTPAPASAAPVAPTPTRPTSAATGGAPKPPTPTPAESGSGKGLALAPPAIAVTEEKKDTTNLSLSIPTATAPAKSPAVSPRSTKAESEAAKELSELDNLMQLSLKENDELSRKLIEMEIKLKLLENNLPASKMEDLKAGSLRNVDLRPELHPDYVAPTTATHTTTTMASPSDAPASPVAQFDESQKKVVFSKKLNTKEYFEMFKTRSKLIVPAKTGRQPLARGVPVTASDAPAPAIAVAAPAAVAAAPAPAAAPVSAPTVVVGPAPEAAPGVPAAAPAAAPTAPAAPAEPTVVGYATVEEAKAEVAELNDMVENSIQENEELMKEVANLRVKLEDAEQRAHKYKHKASSSKKKLGKKLHLLAAFSAFLESGGKDREKLLEEAPPLKDALAKFDAAHK